MSQSPNTLYTTSPCSDPSSPNINTGPLSMKRSRSGATSGISLPLCIWRHRGYNTLSLGPEPVSRTPHRPWFVSLSHPPSLHWSVPSPESLWMNAYQNQNQISKRDQNSFFFVRKEPSWYNSDEAKLILWLKAIIAFQHQSFCPLVIGEIGNCLNFSAQTSHSFVINSWWSQQVKIRK